MPTESRRLGSFTRHLLIAAAWAGGGGMGCAESETVSREAGPAGRGGAAPRSAHEGVGTMKTLDMDAFAWSHRPVVLFADGPQNLKLMEQQRRLVDHEADLSERVMPIITVAGDAVTWDGEAVEADAGALRQRYGVLAEAGFVVLLVGKDTGVKLRRTQPVEAAELLALVDSMPMRRSERRGE